MRCWSWFVVVLAAVVTLDARQSADESRSAWRYRRQVELPANPDGALVAVALPPELQAHSQPTLRDLRLIDTTGREVPFLIQEDTARRIEQRWSGYLTEAQRERREFSTWTVDFGEVIRFDHLEIDLPGLDFSKHLALDVSVDGATWRELGRDYWIFDRVWQAARVHDTTIELPATEARFVRLQAEDVTSPALPIRAVMALRTDDLAGASWTQDLGLELISNSGGKARYRLLAPDGLPVRRLALDADDPAFARRVTVYEQGRDELQRIGVKMAYRLRLPGAPAALESRDIDIIRHASGGLLLEVENGDNPPLSNPRARVWGPRTMLLTAPTAQSLTLYYGNSVTRAPVYDLERFRVAAATVSEYPVASVGAEAENPSFRQPPPLEFVATRGAMVSSSDWRFSRTIPVSGADDLYTLTVSPVDLARLRPDLGDLRFVDDADRQLPYVLERDASTTAIRLTVAPTSPRAGRRQTSAFRFVTQGVPGGAGALHVSALRVRIREPFFQRRAEVLVPQRDAPLGAVSVATATLSSGRRAETKDPVWVDIPIGTTMSPEWSLEVADGDNAPLTVLEAQAVVPVPRVTFKAAPGSYRLLLGNPNATAPSYELDALRQEVLAYAAVPLEVPAGPAEPANPAYRQSLSDYVRNAPPRVVLWTTLGIAVLALLLLTRRIIGKSSPPSS